MSKHFDSIREKKSQLSESIDHTRARKFSAIGFGALMLLIIATNPVAAQGNNSTINICQSNNVLVGISNAVIQLSIYGGLAGVFVTYFATTFAETLPIGQDSMQSIRDQRKSAMKGAAKLLAIGPVGYIIIQFANLPFASCIDLIPF